MYKKLKIVKADSRYCDYLRQFDNRVIYNAGTKELRPFVGVLFSINKCDYFAPLSSPKPKHLKLKNTLDLIKISDGEYGVVNFNNMIPVTSNNYTEFDLDKLPMKSTEKMRYILMRKQLRWLTDNREDVYFKSKLLYKLYKDNKLPSNVRNRCCNFILLEEKCKEYNNLLICE